MALRSLPIRFLRPRQLCVFALTVLVSQGFSDNVDAQGLSGTPQRLEETLGRAEPPKSGAGQSNSGSSQTPTAGQYSVGQQSGYGGSSSGPPPGYGGSGGQQGQQSGYGGSSGGPPPGYGGSGQQSGYGGSSSGPPPGYGGPPAGYDDMEEMEDYGDGGYGGSSGYGGPGGGGYGGPASRGGRSGGLGSQSDTMQAYGSGLLTSLGEIDLMALFAPAPANAAPSGPVLQYEAEQAFKAGNQAIALELMFGHMAAEYEDASAMLRSVKYSKQLRRPVWSVRWGVSMEVRGDAVDDPSPIEEGATPRRQNLAGGPRGQQGGYGGDADYGGGEGGYGEEMEDMEEEMERGMESEMEMEMMEDMEMAMGGGSGMGRGRGGRPGAGPAVPAIPVREMLSSSADEKLRETLGLVATVTAEQFEKRYKNGDFGALLTSVSAPAPAPKQRGGFPGQPVAPSPGSSMSAALNEILVGSDEPMPMWKPGIVFLGEGSRDEVLAAARKANVDLVLHFQVYLKARNEQVSNVSRCRLLNVGQPDPRKSVLISSKGMDNFEASKLAGAGRMDEREYVEAQLQSMWELIDRDVKVMPLPAFPADVARNRIATLIDSPNAHSLRTLAEIRLFQAQGLIDQSEVEAAFDIIGGDDGLMLLHGPQAKRVEIARTWASGE